MPYYVPSSSQSYSPSFGQDQFIPTQGQTSFNLSSTPIALSVRAVVNSADLIYGTDFTLGGTTVTILTALGYNLSPTDVIQFTYLKA